MKDIAVVILNWNGVHFLEEYLGKVVEYSGDAQIVVADNASSDNSVEFVQSNFPSVRIVQNAENGGFARGYNEALAQVDSPLYVLLNSDVEVTPNWLEPLREAMNDPRVAGCQPKIRAVHDRNLFEYAGASGGFMDNNYFPFCRGRIFDTVETDTAQYDDIKEVFWATGAALMIRSSAYHEVGGLDEDFFAHMEEIDLCWRLKKRNYRFLVVPKSAVYHVGGGSLSYTSPQKTYLNFRNNSVMLIKNHDGWLFPKLFWRMSLEGIAGAKFLFSGEFRNFWAVFRAHIYLYRHARTLWRKRIEVRKHSTTFNATGWYRGNIIWNYYAKKVHAFDRLNQRLFK